MGFGLHSIANEGRNKNWNNNNENNTIQKRVLISALASVTKTDEDNTLCLTETHRQTGHHE